MREAGEELIRERIEDVGGRGYGWHGPKRATVEGSLSSASQRSSDGGAGARRRPSTLAPALYYCVNGESVSQCTQQHVRRRKGACAAVVVLGSVFDWWSCRRGALSVAQCGAFGGSDWSNRKVVIRTGSQRY